VRAHSAVVCRVPPVSGHADKGAVHATVSRRPPVAQYTLPCSGETRTVYIEPFVGMTRDPRWCRGDRFWSNVHTLDTLHVSWSVGEQVCAPQRQAAFLRSWPYNSRLAALPRRAAARQSERARVGLRLWRRFVGAQQALPVAEQPQLVLEQLPRAHQQRHHAHIGVGGGVGRPPGLVRRTRALASCTTRLMAVCVRRWRQVPAPARPHVQFYNVPVSEKPGDGDFAWNFITSLVTHDDYVVVKVPLPRQHPRARGTANAS
jgi:hypothetical protein